MENFNQFVGNCIKDIRKNNNCTKKFIAETVLNMSTRTYTRIENGNTAISFEDLLNFLDFFHMSFQDFEILFRTYIKNDTYDFKHLIQELLIECQSYPFELHF